MFSTTGEINLHLRDWIIELVCKLSAQLHWQANDFSKKIPDSWVQIPVFSLNSAKIAEFKRNLIKNVPTFLDSNDARGAAAPLPPSRTLMLNLIHWTEMNWIAAYNRKCGANSFQVILEKEKSRFVIMHENVSQHGHASLEVKFFVRVPFNGLEL